MNLGQNVCLDHLWVRFSKCYDTQVNNTGPSWPYCILLDVYLCCIFANRQMDELLLTVFSVILK